MLRNNRGNVFTIIELLVVVVIILVLANYMLRGYVGEGNSLQEKVNTPKGRAESVSCMNNLKQIRYAIDMYRQSDEQNTPPPSLDALRPSGVSGDVVICPVSKVPYSYDPGQGRVWCTTPGHEKY